MNIIGIAFIVMGVIIFLIDFINKKKCKETVTGHIVDVYKITSIRGDGAKKRTYYPIYQYNVDGTAYVKKATNGSKFAKFEIGDEVEIKYNPKNPNRYCVKGNMIHIIMSLIWIMLGIAMIVLGQGV